MKKQSNFELKYFKNLTKTFQPEYNKIEKEFGNCLDCDIPCCYDMKVTIEETDILKISRYLKIPPKQFKEEYTEMYVYESKNERIIKFKDDYCPFYKDKLCSIHEIKPENCRIFPLTIDIWKDTGLPCLRVHQVFQCHISTNFMMGFLEYLGKTDKESHKVISDWVENAETGRAGCQFPLPIKQTLDYIKSLEMKSV